MLVEFTRFGKTYTYTAATLISDPPPPKLTIPFKPCPLKPPFMLELQYLGFDDVRMIALYRPVREIP